MDSTFPFGYTHMNKRSHAQMDLEDSGSSHWSPFDSRPSISREPSDRASDPRHQPESGHSNLYDVPQLPQPRRFPGDGMDYRRPVTSSNVIDLTSDDAGPPPQDAPYRQYGDRAPPRQPRFGRPIMADVIDLEAEEQHRRPPRSPDIEFVSSRSIDRPGRSSQGTPNDADEDEVEFVGEAPLSDAERRRRNRPLGIGTDLMQAMLDMPHLRATVERRHNAAGTRHAERQRQHRINHFLTQAHNARTRSAPRAPPRLHGRVHIGFVAPNLQYGHVGFDLGYQHDDDEEVVQARAPTYEAPAPAPEGFTRSPQEEESLICPNCEDELCVGDSEQKRQVWIVKTCGHVYCGECTANRYISKSNAKGKEKQPTSRKFKECVVDGCNKKVSNQKTMVQIFL